MSRPVNISSRTIKWISLILIVLIIIGMIIYPRLKNNRETEKQREEVLPQDSKSKPLSVYYEVIRPQPLTEKIYAVGSLSPDEEVDLAFESSGKLTKIYFKEGTMVRKGELLAKINDLPLQAQLQKLDAQVPLAENRLHRQQTLLDKDAVSREAFEQVTSELDQLRADIELVKSQISQTELRAPFDGYIGLRMVSEGSFVSPTTVISRLTKVSPMKVDFSVSEKYAFQVHNGTKIKFKADGDLKVSEATVYALDATINPDTRTRAVRAVFPNTNREWMPGAFVSVEIILKEIPDAVTIPSQALIPEMGVDKVFIYKSGKAQPVEVIGGLRTDARVQVVQGLYPGDTLLTSGMLQLRTGMNVELNE